MDRNQETVRSFHARAFMYLMRVDRIFLCRKLFVALAMVLGVTGLALAQHTVNQGRTDFNNSHAAEPRASAITGTVNSSSAPSPAAKIEAPSSAVEVKRIVGETKPLGNGAARSWVSLDKDGKPLAIGLTFSEEALSSLPKEPPPGAEGTEVSFALPSQASTAFKHIGLNWNPHGHPPAKVYDLPHFDFHFYMISEEERGAITAKGDDLARSRKQPAAEFIPQGYIYVPDSEVPRMGAHWVNPGSKELQGQTFTTTFLYGSHDGRLVFAEPMIARAFLEMKTDVSEKLTLPVNYARRGYYPTRYSVRYDAVAREYTIALEGMTLR